MDIKIISIFAQKLAHVFTYTYPTMLNYDLNWVKW